MIRNLYCKDRYNCMDFPYMSIIIIFIIYFLIFYFMSPYSPQMEAIIDAINSIKLLTNSREKSLVLTKLEEAYLWLKELENAGAKC